MFLAGGFSRLAINAREAGHSDKAASFGAAAAAMIFIFTSVFGATWLTGMSYDGMRSGERLTLIYVVPWIYPAEIYPLAVRARGNAWGVVGWSIGNGWLVSVPLASPCFSFPFPR